MKLRVPTRILCLSLVGTMISACVGMSSIRVADEPMRVPSRPSAIAGSETPDRILPRVMFDSEHDDFKTPDTLTYALSLTGSRYRYGGTSPREGFDCSGFVRHVFGQFGVELPRSARDMAVALPRIDSAARQPGDLLFFNTNGRPFSHVGIYLGNGRFVHATSSRGKSVKISRLAEAYWTKRFEGVRRPPTQALAVSNASGLVPSPPH